MNNTIAISPNSIDSTLRGRISLGILSIIATFALLLLATVPANADGDDKRGRNGTVMSVDSTSLRIATKSGLETVFVDADTKIKRGKDEIALSGINPGDRISARVEPLERNLLLATKIKVRGKSSEKQVQHLTGVVIENDSDSFTLASRNGESVEIELDEDDEQPTIADVVTTIVENDLATGRVKAKQIDKVEKIVQRLEESLAKQVDKAKAKVLKKIIDESARQHLDTLNQTLDQVEDEAKDKISAALTKFRSEYAKVAERVGNDLPQESYEGVIAAISTTSVTVASPGGNGARTFVVDANTGIVLDGIENPSTLDLLPGQSVIVGFLPTAEGSDVDALALTIEVLPPSLPPVVADVVEELSNDVIEGEITKVETDPVTDAEIVIIEQAGSGDTVGVEVTDDTVINVDGATGTVDQLEPGQQIEATVDETGVAAETVVVSTGTPSVDEVPISGIVSGNDPVRGVIMITPPTGDQIRLNVLPNTVITLDGATATLDQVQEMDVVLSTSRYLPVAETVTRLAVASPSSPTNTTPAAEETPPSTDGPSPTPTPTSSGFQPFSIRGVVKSFSGENIVFDGMTLPKSSGFTLPEGVTEGSEVDLVFTVTEDGTVILTGIQPS